MEITSWMPTPVLLDGEVVTVEIKRLSIEEFTPFERRYHDFERPNPDDAHLTIPPGASDEETRGLIEAAERDLPMADREARRIRREQRADALVAWTSQAIRTYVRVPAGQITVDGAPITTGEQILAHFGAKVSALFELVNRVWFLNVLTAAQRKNFESHFGSSTTSEERPLAPVGPRLAPIAGAVESAGSVGIADATPAPPSEGTSSGETLGSAPPSVPSGA